MKKIGLIGGVGWPSTIEYYQLLCQLSQNYHASRGFQPPYPIPEIAIESLNIHYSLSHRGSDKPGSWDQWDNYFNNALKRLENSGAKILAIASVTPHARLSSIQSGIELPIISVYDAVGAYCRKHGVQGILILGTLPTMTNRAFEVAMKSYGIGHSVPKNAIEREQIVKVIKKLYANELEGQREILQAIVQSNISAQSGSTFAVCLACTELTTAFPEHANKTSFFIGDVHYLNTSAIHANEIFAQSVCSD